MKKAKEALASRGAELVAVDRNPIDEVWKDRPEASKAHLVVQPDQYAGKSAAEKRTEIGDWLAKHHADAAVLSALDSIAWAFNIRGAGRDPHAGRAGLCARPRRRHRRSVRRRREDRAATSASISATASASTNAPRSRARCRELKGKTVVVDPERAVAAIFDALEQGRRQDLAAARSDDPAQGDQEPGRDCRPEGRPDPRRRRHRRASSTGSTRKRRRAMSTSSRRRTISKRFAARIRSCATSRSTASRAPGRTARSSTTARARRPTASSRQGTLYLIDSGGQYVDGTTDITRTVPIGEPTDGDARPLHPRAQGPYRDRDGGLPQGHARQSSSTASPAGRCGKRASITPTAPATASAASSRSTKARSASRRSAARRAAATSRSRPA